jgi:iron complex outermembrane receptor protein
MPTRISAIRPTLAAGWLTPWLLSPAGPAAAQETKDKTDTAPVTIQVSSPRLGRSLYDTPSSLSVVQADDIASGQPQLQLDEALATVPGLYFQNRYNFAQNLRLSMRGFGSRAPFGVRGIHLRVDGIPYTLPDGQAQVDAVDLASVERIEVIRGPASVQYGNAAGGVVDITTRTGTGQPGSSLRLDAGSDGFYKGQLQGQGESGPVNASASLSWLDYEGYREQSEVHKGLFNGRVSYQSPRGRTVTTTLNLLETPQAEDPGGLTVSQAQTDRQQASGAAIALDAGQEVSQQTVGLIYEDPIALPGKVTLGSFLSRRDFRQQLPFPGPSLIDYERLYYGGYLQYQHSFDVQDRPVQISAGTDAARQQDDRSRYRVSFDREITGQTQQEDQTATSLGVFVQGDVEWSGGLRTSLGLRHDYLKLAIDDRWLADGEDGSGSRRFHENSGMFGISYRLAPQRQLYANIGTAFESPTFTEFARPDGRSGFNPDLEPQETVSQELGMRGVMAGELEYDVALFSADVRNEILPFDQDGRTFYQNAGKTDRRGIEVGLGWTPAWAWRVTSALTLAEYQLDSFGDNSGNRMPGLPRQQWVNQLRWRSTDQHYLSLETRYQGKVYAENSNQTRVNDYWLVHLRGGKTFRFGDQQLELFAGIRNLLDEDYFGNIRINANSDRPDPADRGYFEPAPERHFHAGAKLSF